jgi:hypothetical protein
MPRSSASLVVACAATLSATAVADDPPCEPAWSDQFPASRLDRWVWDLAVFDDGTGPAVYAGGGFSVDNGDPADYIASLDGNVWKQVGGGLDSDGWALAACQECPDPGPNLYAGGGFGEAGGVPVSNVARWDGTAWSALGSGVTGAPLGWVFDLIVAPDVSGRSSVLYAGGHFDTAGGATANNIAQWDGAAWSPLGDGVNNTVYALAVFDDGSGRGAALYVGGIFSSAGGVAVNNIARWDGASWHPVADGLDGTVYALAVFDDGSGPTLYAGGTFTHAGAAEALGIATWDGSSWSPVGGGTDGYVTELTVGANGARDGSALYVGGEFTTVGTVPANNIAGWDGSTWSAFGAGVSGGVRGITLLDDGSRGQPVLYAGGFFHGAGDSDAEHVAKWDGSTWTALGNGVDDLGIRTFEVDDEESPSAPTLYAGGEFRTAGSIPARSVAAWDGAQWSGLGEGLEGRIDSLALYDDGSGAGARLHAGGAAVIAVWDEESWQTVDGGVGGPVCALEVHDDGTGPALYVGGFFETAGGVPVTNIARWDGSSWSAVGDGLPGGDAPSTCAVWDMVTFDDGGGNALYAGGSFRFDPEVERGVARWDGIAWSPLPDLPGLVVALAVYDDGQGSGPGLYAGGYFSATVDGADLVHIARWDGTSWSDVGAPFDEPPYTHVSALAVYDDGTGAGPALYVGGTFHEIGGGVANLIAAWDGTTWSALGAGLGDTEGGFPPEVDALAVFDDGAGQGAALFAGGRFLTAGGLDSWNVAKWGGCAGPPPGDIDGDGVVGVEDFLLLLEAWGPCPSPCPPHCPADLDADCAVGVTDFLLMLANWT